MKNFKTIMLVSAVMSCSYAGMATATDVTANIAATSDYVFRGFSLNDENPTMQAGINAVFDHGWSASIFASEVDNRSDDGVEVDYNLRWGAMYVDLGGRVYNYGLGVTQYEYSNDVFDDYTEFNYDINTPLSSGVLSLEINYADDFGTDGLGDKISYIDGNLGYAAPLASLIPAIDHDIEINLRIGRGEFMFDNMSDFDYTYGSVGLSKTWDLGGDSITANVEHHMTNVNNFSLADDRTVMTLSYNFD